MRARFREPPSDFQPLINTTTMPRFGLNTFLYASPFTKRAYSNVHSWPTGWRVANEQDTAD